MFAMIVLLVLAFPLGIICWWFYIFYKNRALAKYMGPRPIPVIGNVHSITSTKDIIPVFMRCLKKYGPVVRIWIGFRPKIVVSDYKIAEKLLGSTQILDKSYDYDFFRPWIGNGLLTSTGHKWRKHRKLLTPVFHFRCQEQYINTFNKQSDVLIERLNTVADNTPFNIYPYINLCTLDNTYEAIMGVQIHAQTKLNSEYLKCIEEISRIILARTFSVVKSIDLLYHFTKTRIREMAVLQTMLHHTNSVIEAREKIYDSEMKSNADIQKRSGFLDLLLASQHTEAHLTKEDIRAEVDTFMFEGHDTGSAGLAFILYCLSIYSQAQKKAVEEIQTITHKHSYISEYDLKCMKYLEMVIKESMRLYPPVPIFSRGVSKDTEFDGIVVPKGTNFTMFSYGLHRQEEMFPEPEKFDPERFSPEKTTKRSPFSYVPFSAGPRNCLGQRFAMAEMKLLIAKILLNFEILPVPSFQPILKIEVVLRSDNGIVLRLKPR